MIQILPVNQERKRLPTSHVCSEQMRIPSREWFNNAYTALTLDERKLEQAEARNFASTDHCLATMQVSNRALPLSSSVEDTEEHRPRLSTVYGRDYNEDASTQATQFRLHGEDAQ